LLPPEFMEITSAPNVGKSNIIKIKNTSLFIIKSGKIKF